MKTKTENSKDKQEREVRNRIKQDIKNELNPLFSISIGSWYSEKEMLEDISQLMIAENSLGYNQALQERLKELDEDILWLKKFKSFLFGSPYDSELVKQKLAHKIEQRDKLKETS